MDAFKNAGKIGLIVCAILIVTILHYSSDHGTLRAHIIHRELYFIPILLSSFWFGLKYGLAISLIISLTYTPYVFLDRETHGDLWPVFFQIAMFNIVAALVGFLVERTKRQQEKVFATEKSAALAEAATAVGHEMKSLLKDLQSMADRIGQQENAVSNRDLEKGLARLKQLVDILSAFKAAGPSRLFSHDLNDIIRDRVQGHRVLAKRNAVILKTDLDAEGCPSRVDPETIGRVFDRIIQNALEVSSPGQAIHIRSTRRSDHCEVTIADEGPGIRPEHISKIFKPFFTTKEKGDGLALSSSQKIVREMGGEIQVTSQYGRGAAFTVIVPLEYSAKAPEPHVPPG